MGNLTSTGNAEEEGHNADAREPLLNSSSDNSNRRNDEDNNPTNPFNDDDDNAVGLTVSYDEEDPPRRRRAPGTTVVAAAAGDRSRRRSSTETERRSNISTSSSRSNSRVVETQEEEDVAEEGESLLPTTTNRDYYDNDDNIMDDDDDLYVCCHCCKDRCPRLCCVLAYVWKCIRYTSWPFYVAIKARRTKVTLPCLFVSIVLFATTMWLSGYTTKWTLNAGESRRILARSWLTKSVGVEVTAPHSTVEIDVYAINGKCPPLTGERVRVQHPHEKLIFAPGQYQYDYFYLNKGSQVTAKLDQEEGVASEVYMLEGQDKLATLQKKHSNDDWIDKLISTTHLHWTAKYQRGQYSPVTASFRSIQTDIYTLLYDNPYPKEGELDLDISLDLTTYNLQNYKPVCHDIAVHKCPPVPHKSFTFKPQCIIMEGVPTNWHVSNNDQVPLKIIEHRNYAFIVLLSLLPTIVAILWEFWNCFREQLENCRQRRRRQDRSENLPPSYEPPEETDAPPPVATRVRSSSPPPPSSSSSSRTSRIPPPPSSSKSRASAPPASQDDDNNNNNDETIPLVRAESVVPVEEDGENGATTTLLATASSSADSQQTADV